MKVIHLISGDLWAGAEVQLFNVVCALKRYHNVNVQVLLFNHGVLEQRLLEAGVPTTVLDESRMSGPMLLCQLAKIIRERRPDILHSNRYKENVLGSIAALGCASTKSVRTVHGAPEFTVNLFNLKKSLPQWLDQFCARLLQRRVICVSPQLVSLYSGWLPPERLKVVANGIDVERLERESTDEVMLPGGAGKIKIGFVGRMNPVKRVDLIIEIARQLQAIQPGRYVFYLFGDGPLRNALVDRAKQYGLDNVVHFMGFVPTPAPYVRHMDVLLMTSDHEGLPMTVLEALYLKVHVISHAVGAIPEVLGDGNYGTLIHGQRPEDYVHAIEAYAASPGAIREMAEAGRRHVIAQYSSARASREYLSIYQEVIAG